MERWGLNVMGYVEPKPGIPASPSHTIQLIEEMKRQSVKLIVVEPYFEPEDAQSIAARVGGTVLVLAPSVGGVKAATGLHPVVRLQCRQACRRVENGHGQ